MCLEDIRIQRKTTSSEKTVVVTDTASLLVGPSEDRTCLIISTGDANDIFISTNGTPSATNGFRLQAGQSPLVLTLLQHGDIVTKGFMAVSPTDDEVICVWETSFEDK